MITIIGKSGIKATVLSDSISEQGIRILTFEIQYPRLVLSEMNTHRVLSKNSASSRAIPFNKMVSQLNGLPVRFGAANPGMQDTGEDFDKLIEGRCVNEYETETTGCTAFYQGLESDAAWEMAKIDAVFWSEAFFKAGYHKQVYNRLTEPFQMMKTVISGTEWSNFFWLRDDGMADPTLAELARCMREAKDASTPILLLAGQWHLPYMDWVFSNGWTGEQIFYLKDSQQIISLEEAIKVSCARCAAVSYRNEDYGLAKSVELYERLVGSDKKHASALEHCATPMEDRKSISTFSKNWINIQESPWTWQNGISHMDKNGQLWSGNIKGWIQHRKTIDGENHSE